MRLQHFFLSNTYPVNSSVVHVYKVHVFDEAFFPLSKDCYDVITDQRLFFFPWDLLLGKKFLHDNHVVFQAKLCLKKCSQTDKDCSRKIASKTYLYPHLFVTMGLKINLCNSVFAPFVCPAKGSKLSFFMVLTKVRNELKRPKAI